MGVGVTVAVLISPSLGVTPSKVATPVPDRRPLVGKGDKKIPGA